ncbi:MAG: recombination-associated protein RdgC [Rhodocyclales bacterium]|nr:recombination-associated protein RdgC [Rhodocyclales bacterium]
MWFRNLRIFRLSADWNKDLNQFAAALAKLPLNRCGGFDMQSRGWVYPKDGEFVHVVNGQWLLALGVEQKLLPASVIRQVTQERAAQIEADQARKVGRKEMRDLRDGVTLELLPKAFTCRRTTWAWIDPAHDWLVIDAGADAKADEFLDVLLKSVGDVHVRPLQTQVSPSSAMTEWLAAGDSPAGFSIDDDLELRTAASGESAIRYVRHALEGKEIQAHIANGKIATKLAVTWNDRVSFVLNDKLQLKRLTFLDILKEEAEQSAQDADEQFDVDFALMAGELGRMFDDLLLALGGEAKPV